MGVKANCSRLRRVQAYSQGPPLDLLLSTLPKRERDATQPTNVAATLIEIPVRPS